MNGARAPLLNALFQEELYLFSTPVVVVLPKPWEAYGAETENLLRKILTSVRVNMDTVQMVVQPLADLQSLQTFSPSKVLIFGCDTREDIPYYKETPSQSFTVMRADDLSQLDDQKKKNLWIALRQMFGI